MTLNFSQIRPLTAELSALSAPDCVKNQYLVLWPSLLFKSSLFLDKDIHNISHEFEFRPDPTSDCEVICPGVFEKSIYCVVATLASLFFSGSSSFLQVTRITTISRMSSNFDQIRPLTAKLSALECLKNQYFVLWPLASLFLSGSSSFLQVTRIITISQMSSNIGQI